jgi:transposase
MQRSALLVPNLTIGLDLGDKRSEVCEVDAQGQVARRCSITTTFHGIERHFGGRPACRVILEVGTHSPWISRQLEGLGHEVVVANPSAVYGKRRRKKRNDNMDAEFLARQGRVDPVLLCPIQHRGAEVQQHLALLRARDQLVRARTKLINHVRGSVKSSGSRVLKCSAEAFARRAGSQIPGELRPALEPLLEVIGDLSRRIQEHDRKIERVVDEQYPEARLLQRIKGVGPVTALAFVLLIEDPKRFRESREVGAYFGLVPRLDESSDSKPQLRITKAGDEFGRRLLVSAAQYILGPFGPDCDLRRHGEKIALRGGKNAKKRAAVAVARKLAVLMHHLWIREAIYDPQHLLNARNGRQAA